MQKKKGHPNADETLDSQPTYQILRSSKPISDSNKKRIRNESEWKRNKAKLR